MSRTAKDPGRTPKFAPGAVDAQRWVDGLTPVDGSGATTTAATWQRKVDQAMAAKMYAIGRALDGPRPDLVDRMRVEHARRVATKGQSLADAYASWKRSQVAKSADEAEAEAMHASRRRVAKRLKQGHPPAQALADGFAKYRRHGGRLSIEDWAKAR